MFSISFCITFSDIIYQNEILFSNLAVLLFFFFTSSQLEVSLGSLVGSFKATSGVLIRIIIHIFGSSDAGKSIGNTECLGNCVDLRRIKQMSSGYNFTRYCVTTQIDSIVTALRYRSVQQAERGTWIQLYTEHKATNISS